MVVSSRVLEEHGGFRQGAGRAWWVPAGCWKSMVGSGRVLEEHGGFRQGAGRA